MWWGSGQDPGGSGGEGPSNDPPQNQQLQDLQEQFESQQTLIAQLKEMLKKTENTSVSKEKVEEYASTLSKMTARAKLSKLRKAESAKQGGESSIKFESVKEGGSKKLAVTPAKEKVNLLRQQLEENRLKLAQRDKNQKGIEEMVNQLKAQLDDSQIIISQSTMNVPKVETQPTQTTYTAETSKEDLISTLQKKDKQLEEFNSRLIELQGNIFDLQENLKEKDSVIDARTKAITLLSENLSKKGKNTLDMLDETKEQMRSMQEQFVTLETKMREDNQKLQTELDIKNKQIEELSQTNNVLQEEKNNLHTTSVDLHQKLETLTIELTSCKIELTASESKVQDLTKLNQELENNLSEFKQESSVERTSSLDRSSSTSPSRKQKSRKSKKSTSETSESDRIMELEKLVENQKSEIEKLNIRSTEESEETEKLKKQLETMNKNMIKAKAQYKSKLKDLQKKATPGELKERILNLESDNVKLEQQIAELEEEKGNLQLRLVDIDGTKDKEKIADLENRIEEQRMEIENHIRVINILETQITDKSTEIKSLRNELASLIEHENAQVCSEITSVQLEEQLDKEVYQKKELEDKFGAIKKENESLLEKIEELNKEKQEMNTKLVHYMQENIELIDRLEKSSAEKVSSAESIEIVESLTQQEKLEIEAYQKSLEHFPDKENIEQSDLDQQSDLNESVSKLTEDSSELLERIELFTVERREVMEKMDSLLSEKEHLLEKLDKLETEKKELMKKYDSLFTEKEELVTRIEKNQKVEDVPDGIRMDSASNSALIDEYKILIENQKVEINQLKDELLRISNGNSQLSSTQENLVQVSKEKEALEIIVSSFNEQFLVLKQEYDSFLKENQSLKVELKKRSEEVHEKDEVEEDYREMKKKLNEFEEKILRDAEEINVLQALVEDNKNELIKSADYIASLTSELSVKHLELTNYQNEIDHLQSVVLEMNNEIELKNNTCQQHIETIELLSLQLSELKIVMDENFKDLGKYEELNDKIVKSEKILEAKDTEINNLREENSICEHKIIKLETEMKMKDEQFSTTCHQLKEKYLSLESKIQMNAGNLDDMRGPLEAKIQNLEEDCKKLETKNKEHVEKMKKIAANLKKKATQCQEIESKLTEVKEKWENECREKDEKQKQIEEQQKVIDENKNKVDSLLEQLKDMEGELLNIQNKFEVKNAEYGQLKMDCDNNSQHFKDENEKLLAENMKFVNEIENLNAQLHTKSENVTTENLLQQLNSLQVEYETTRNAMEAKIQEKEMYIENLEADNVNVREKLSKITEGLLQIEERRQSLELKTLQLGAELEAKSTACEEVSMQENFLEHRLEALMSHEESIQRKLTEMTQTNQHLNERVDNLAENNLSLQGKLSEAERRVKEKENECEKMRNLESDSVQLREIISSLEHEIKKLHSDYDKKLLDKNNEVESMDQELNNQIIELNNQRKAAINKSEILEEKIQEFSDNTSVMMEEIEDLKQKLSDAKMDLDKQIQESQELNIVNSDNQLIIEQLRNQLSQLHPVQYDIDSIQSEISRLQQVITEKDHEIENYRKQNMQLQMSMGSATSFPQIEVQEDAAIKNQIHQLTNELIVAGEKIAQFEKTNASLQLKIEEYEKSISLLREELSGQKELLITKAAEHHIDEILSTAVLEAEKQLQPVIEETFEKVIVQEEQATKGQRQTLKEEELEKKIKALEMLLYSMEKEKDDAVSQCHSLSNELTRLIYEREGRHETKDVHKELDLLKLEGEILPIEETENAEQTKKALQTIEFSPTRTKKVSFGGLEQGGIQQPIEEIIQPKHTYLCFDDKPPKDTDEASGWGIEDDILKSTLESQIIPEDSTPITAAEQKEFQLFEYGKVHKPAGQSKTPVEEKIKDPKDSYLCYPEDVNIDVRDTFASEEDGWGWNTEEVKLEVKHQQTLSATPYTPTRNENECIQEKIRGLEEEKNKLSEEIKTQQLKIAKLIKKLRDMKTKNDDLNQQLKHKQMSDFDVLDVAIQDELNVQIKNLEKKLKDTHDENVKDKQEKENLLKRVDVLTSANERILEMKEKLDNEVQMLQFNNRQLNSKLEQFEWGVDSPVKVTTEVKQETSDSSDVKKEKNALNIKIEELTATVNDLTIDNEEMQMLLEEQQKLRVQAEKALQSIPIQENIKTIEEYNKVVEEKSELNDHIKKLIKENETFKENLSIYNEQNNSLTEKIIQIQNTIDTLTKQYWNDLQKMHVENNKLQEYIDKLQQEVETAKNTDILKSEINSLKETIATLQNENSVLQNTKIENEKLQEDLNKIKSEIETETSKESIESEITILKEKLFVLEKENVDLQTSLKDNENHTVEFNNLIEKLTVEKNNLEIKLKEISSVINTENAEHLEGLGEKLEVIVKEIQDKNNEVAELNSILNLERIEFENKLSTTLEQLAHEWSERVEQRGNDVAESWKLHVEARETEFMQLEESLRLELTDMYNKNEVTLADNSELQKKVELLLQEKQAAASDNKTEALQQILTERQAEIISLSQQLQDVTIQIEVKSNEIISLQQIIDSMQKTNHELIEKNDELHNNFKEYEENNTKLEIENQDLQKYSKQNEDLKAQLSIENQETEILKQNVEGLKLELNKVKEELVQENTKSVNSDNRVVHLQKSIETQQTRLLNLIQSIDTESREVYDQSFDYILYLEQWISQVNQKQHELFEINKNLAYEKSILEESQNQASDSVMQYQQNNEKLITEISDLRETIRVLEIDLQESSQSRNIEINQMAAQLQEMDTRYQKELSEKSVQTEKLQEQLSEKLAEIQQLHLQITENTKELENIRQQLSETNLISIQVKDVEASYNMLLSEKNSEAEKLQIELNELNTKYVNDINNLEGDIRIKIQETTDLESKVNELNTLSTEEANQMSELRQLLEQQTEEIKGLKTELNNKNEDLNHVMEELELMQHKKQLIAPEKRVRFEEPVTKAKLEEDSQSSTTKSETEPIKAELDLALYMLHQRDVRCEELTVELMQLLEERDTLQLRLSNAIRINEELRSKLSPQALDLKITDELNTPKVVQPTGAIPKTKSSDIVLKATGTELAMEATEIPDKSLIVDKEEINNKLSQLRSVGYRDKTLQDDQQIRYRQMSIMQQHRDIASRLPPEAAAKLVDASYTLSRDVQSPSKVLLNWLWGKSTPKVNDI